MYNLILNHLKVTLPNPFRRGAHGWGTLGQQNHATGGANGSIMVGMFVSCVFFTFLSRSPVLASVGTHGQFTKIIVFSMF